MRLDVEMTNRKIAESRQKAQDMIRSGVVYVNSVAELKPSRTVTDSDCIEIRGEKLKYVGRGGLKLEYALNAFSLDVSGKSCLDIGASTGGFTDCLLQSGAEKVCAVDVGHGQLHPSLLGRKDVVSREGINVRDLSIEEVGFVPDFVCCDVSFISLTVVIEKISQLFCNGAECVLLIKPQFEAGRQNISKNGIVKDKKTHISVIAKIIDCCRANRIAVMGLCKSPITGGDGNVEYLLYGKMQTDGTIPIDIKTIVG